MTTVPPTPEDVLEKVDTLGPPSTPVTTPEVAEGFDCTQRTIYNRLETLADDGSLQTKKVGANSRVWWRPVDDVRRNGGAFGQRVPAPLREEHAPSDSEMAERIREFEWAETPLGPIDGWPAELQTAVAIMLGTNEAIGIYWGDEHTLLYNDAAIEQIGEKHPDALSQPARNVFPEAWDELGPIHDKVMAGEGPVQNEEYYLPLERSGELEDIWWDASFNPIPGDDGSVGGVLNISFDITDRVRADRELRERKRKAEQRYRTVLDSMDEGFLLADVLFDEDGEPLDVFYRDSNPAATEMVGEEFEGRWLTEIDMAYEDYWYEVFGRVATTGEGERHELYAEPDDIWYNFYVFKPEGVGPYRVAVIFEDITERREAERKLRESEERFRAVANLVPSLLWSNDPGESTFWYNQQWLDYTGQTMEDAADYGWLKAIHPEDREQSLENFQSAVDAGEPLRQEHRIRRHDGEYRWFLVQGRPVRSGGEIIRWYGAATDIHDQRKMRAALERLNDASQELIDANPETVTDSVAELTVDVLDVEYAALWQYDAQTGELELTSEHAATETDLDAVRSSDVSHEDIWDVFINDEVAIENVLDIADDESWPSRLGSRAIVPLGRHGVAVIGAAHTETFDGRLADLAKMVATTVEAAWDRAESEAQLEEQNEELTRLDRLNSLIREIDTSLVEAETVEAIDDTVCERLVASPLYEFAWVGEFDATADAVRPRSWAGVGASTVEELAIASDSPTTVPDPFVTAIRTHEMQVIEDIATGARSGSWREVALKRGARSCFSIPLTYDEATYGVLVVYGGSPAQSGHVGVLAEFGRTIAHAINAVETRDSFQADSVAELTLRSTAADTPLCRLARTLDSELEFEGLVPGTDDVSTVFFRVPGTEPEKVVAAGEDVLGITDVTPLTEGDDGPLFNARMGESTLAGLILERNATVRSLRIDSETATVVVDLPGSASVRTFVEELTREVPDLELLSRRTRTREREPTLRRAVLDRLTPRQQEVLQLAYRSGYFELPRVRTGAELADELGIVPSTFTKHIRGAERNVLEVVLADGREPRGEEVK